MVLVSSLTVNAYCVGKQKISPSGKLPLSRSLQKI